MSSIYCVLHICRSNILISKHGEARICDLGFSITLPERMKGKTLVTMANNLPFPAIVGYMPPEYYIGRVVVTSQQEVFMESFLKSCPCIYRLHDSKSTLRMRMPNQLHPLSLFSEHTLKYSIHWPFM